MGGREKPGQDGRGGLDDSYQVMFPLVVAGFSRIEIAKNFRISVATVRREVDRAVDSRRLEAPDRCIRLQVERLTKALRTADILVENGRMSAVEPWLKKLKPFICS